MECAAASAARLRPQRAPAPGADAVHIRPGLIVPQGIGAVQRGLPGPPRASIRDGGWLAWRPAPHGQWAIGQAGPGTAGPSSRARTSLMIPGGRPTGACLIKSTPFRPRQVVLIPLALSYRVIRQPSTCQSRFESESVT